MKDFYLYDHVPVLKNLLNIKNQKELEAAESDITYIKLLDIDQAIELKTFDYQHLLKIHKCIFEDIYSWAGRTRLIEMVKRERVLGGDTVKYTPPDHIEKECIIALNRLNRTDWSVLSIDETASQFAERIAQLWQIHPFREGNTRTIITFATQFAEVHGFTMDKILLKDSAGYVRDALVKASDGPYAEIQYLAKIFKEAILRG